MVTKTPREVSDAEIERVLAEARANIKAFDEGDQLHFEPAAEPEEYEEDEVTRNYYENLEREHYDAFVRPKINGHAKDDKQIKQLLQGIDAASLKGKQKPREFLDKAEIFPLKNVALFSGDGAVGKSLLILQLAIACTTDTQWLGTNVEQGPVIYYSCEDDEQEIANRVNDIADAEKIDLDGAKELLIIDMVGKDSVLAESMTKDGKMKPTAMFTRLMATVAAVKPILLILDNLADIFSGNENNRGHAKQFVTMLRGACLQYGTTVIMLGHPSLSGLASGTGMSGSTAWNNSVRCRPYFHRPDGADDDPDDRIFEVKKANYAAAGSIRWELKWKKGRFVKEYMKSAFDRISVDDIDRVKEKFASGQWRINEQSQDWGGYAVADLLGWDIGRGLAAKERSKEQSLNRANIRTYLGTWVRAKSIYIIDGFTAKREKTQFYSNKPGLHTV